MGRVMARKHSPFIVSVPGMAVIGKTEAGSPPGARLCLKG
jgi:hypothetical protein